MQITALAGGVGGARFLRGLRAHLDASHDADLRAAQITVIGNTGDDITLFGLRVCPDLDTVMYTLGGGIDEAQGWGRADETHAVQDELAAYGVQPQWFGLGDRDFATHIARSQMLDLGYPLSQVDRGAQPALGPAGPAGAAAADDRRPGRDPCRRRRRRTGPEPQAIHFQEWWVRLRAAVPARQIVAVGIEQARPGPGVLQAIRDADVVLLPPSNPVVSIGIILGVPGGPRDRCAAPARRRRRLAPRRRPPGAGPRRRLPGRDRGRDDDRRGRRPVRRLPGRLAGRHRRPPGPGEHRRPGHRAGPAAADARRRRRPPRSPAPRWTWPWACAPRAAVGAVVRLSDRPATRPRAGGGLAGRRHARGAGGRRPGRAAGRRRWPASGLALRDGDVLVVSSKVVSKALGPAAPGRPRGRRGGRQTVREVARRRGAGRRHGRSSRAGPVRSWPPPGSTPRTSRPARCCCCPRTPTRWPATLRARVDRPRPRRGLRPGHRRHRRPAVARRRHRLRPRRRRDPGARGPARAGRHARDGRWRSRCARSPTSSRRPPTWSRASWTASRPRWSAGPRRTSPRMTARAPPRAARPRRRLVAGLVPLRPRRGRPGRAARR